MIPFVFAFPVICAIAWMVLMLRGPRAGLLPAALAAGALIAAGLWSIAQSRASTAGIGILFLPSLAALAGASAWVFGSFRRHAHPALRAAAWLGAAASSGLVIAFVATGVGERAKNAERDRAQAEQSRQIDDNRQRIERLLRENSGREETILDGEIAKHRDDRTFLIPALETEFVSEDRLDELSASGDLGVVLTVARNQRTRSGTLEKIYRTNSYPFYFYDALAANPNTPIDVLRALSVNHEPISSLDHSFARNPSTPRDILERIAQSAEAYPLGELLQNPALDCALLQKTEGSLKRLDPAGYEPRRGTIARLESRLCER